MKSGFLDKLIERIRRVQPEEVQNYLIRLAQEKGFLERIFDALQEGVFVTVVQGKIQFFNAAAGHLFALEPEEIRAKRIVIFFRGLGWPSLRSTEGTVSPAIELFNP